MIDLTKLDMSQDTSENSGSFMPLFIILLVVGGFFLYKTFVQKKDEEIVETIAQKKDEEIVEPIEDIDDEEHN